MLGIPFLEVFFKNIQPVLYDDFADRLNYYYTCSLMIFFTILVSAKQYVGKPIQCWVPAQFRGGWEQYIEDYCFIQNTYFVPFDEALPDEDESRATKEIGYYQWVPIVIAIQALMFHIPHLFWKGLHWQSGMNLKAIMLSAEAAGKNQDAEKRDGAVQQLAHYMEESLGLQHDLAHARSGVGFGGCTLRGGFVSSCYLMVKVLYLCNVVGQFFVLNSFLGTEYNFWGVQIMGDLVNGREWADSGHFPRVTMCDFKVRKLGNIHRHTVQCVLMINLFNEKIYLFLWFWMLFVALCTALSALYWLYTIVLPTKREQVVHKYLRIAADVHDSLTDRYAIRRFTNHALRLDGVLVLRFVGSHVSEMVALELTGVLWKDYLSRMATLPSDRKGFAHIDSPSSKTTSVGEKNRDGGMVETLYGVDGAGKNSASAPLLEEQHIKSIGYPGPPPPAPPHVIRKDE